MIPQDIQDEVKKSSSYHMYFKVLLGLVVLTLMTLGQPVFMPSGIAGTLTMQLVIAFFKSWLIIAYYMHLKYESYITIAFVNFAIAILVIMFGLTYMDYYYILGTDWF